MTRSKGHVKKSAHARHLTRHDWLEAALRLVVQSGVQGLKVKELAAAVGATTGSLYWHFRDRSELMDALLEHWAERSTREILDRARATRLAPEARLLYLMREVLDNDATSSDLAFRAWARSSERAADAVKRVDRLREETVGRLFEEMGFRGTERETRARLLICYESCERVVYPDLPRSKRHELLKARHALLCRRRDEA